jgi:hypothetical protein
MINRISPSARPWAEFVIGAWLTLSTLLVRGEVRLNEFMARNLGAVVDSYGQNADWIELHNPGSTAVDLGGYGLILQFGSTNRWDFPKGVSVNARGYLVIWCDASRAASTQPGAALNSGQSLSGQGGLVGLVNKSGQTIDSVEYGFQLDDASLGRATDLQWQLQAVPSPGKTNGLTRSTGTVQELRINEWMADPKTGSDWIELFNPNDQPVSLTGCLLTDDPASPVTNAFPIGPLSLIEAGGWVLFIADKKTNSGPDHVSFSLNKRGGALLLSDAKARQIDRIDYGQQTNGISEGRLPDGDTTLVAFRDSVSPDGSNYRPVTNFWVNELLSHTDPPQEDAVEFYNPSAEPIPVGGWFLSNQESNPKKYRLPTDAVIPPYDFLVLYEYQFKGTNNFTFNSAHGDSVILNSADASGKLTGQRLKQDFGAAANGISFGRFPATERVDFVAVRSLTFGVSSPSTTIEFRKGSGAGNTYPLTGPLVISELMYHPPDAWTLAVTNTTTGFEYVELRNITAQPVLLHDPEHTTNTWKLDGEVKFSFPSGVQVPANSMLLIVDFHPKTNLQALAAFREKYPSLPANTLIMGPFEGKLNNGNGKVSLYRPDPTQEPPHPDAGFVPFILVDQVRYSDAAPWPVEADGQGLSLQRQQPNDYGDDVVNWLARVPNPGQPNEIALPDTDHDGMPDIWELEFGFDPENPADASQDADHDGASNWSEYVAGTYPRNSSDYLMFQQISETNGVIEIQFPARAGRTYTVESATVGKTLNWHPLIELGAKTNDWQCLIHNLTSATNSGVLYRIRTPHLTE